MTWHRPRYFLTQNEDRLKIEKLVLFEENFADPVKVTQPGSKIVGPNHL